MLRKSQGSEDPHLANTWDLLGLRQRISAQRYAEMKRQETLEEAGNDMFKTDPWR